MFAEVSGNHVRNADAHQGYEMRKAMTDGLPILLAAVLPAVALALGSLEIIEPRQALWIGVILALLQLVGLGAFVGVVVPDEHSSSWRCAAVTAAIGAGVVILLVALGH